MVMNKMEERVNPVATTDNETLMSGDCYALNPKK
jgi:hypothetical protein